MLLEYPSNKMEKSLNPKNSPTALCPVPGDTDNTKGNQMVAENFAQIINS